MKILIVRGRATDPAQNKIAECLSRNGYAVEILLWNRQNTQSPENSGYQVKNFNFKAPQNNVRVFFFFPLWWLYEFIYLLRSDAEIIHVCDLDTLYPAILAKFFKRTKLVYTIYDFYANNLPPMNPLLMRQLFWSFFSKIEKFGIRFTDLLMLVDESRYEEIKGASVKNLVYIYNSPADRNDKNFQDTGNPEKSPMTVFYSGPVNKMRGIQYMVDAIKSLEDILLIIGGHIDDETFFNTLMKGNNTIQFIGWTPTYDGILQKTKEADVLFRFSDPKHPKTRYESPNKLFEAMMCSKPIIVSDESCMADIVRKKNCGCVVPFGDIQTLVKTLIQLRDHKDFRQILGKNGRKAYVEEYGWAIMEKRLITAYKNLKNEG
jgi:glycosyltransferase involved in cell wall biosynthesis